VIIIVLVLLAGVFSGLTLGLMGLDSACTLTHSLALPDYSAMWFQVILQVLSPPGTSAERRHAPKVLEVIKKGRHTILVVLLFGERTSRARIQGQAELW